MSDVDIEGLNNCRIQTVNDILDLLKINDKVACNRYTGFGKSYFVVRNLIDKLNSSVLIVVPNEHLLTQYSNWYVNNKNIEVISYQSIRYKTDEYIYNNYKRFRYIICDECHHLGNNKWRNEFDRLNNIVNAKVIGFTATPTRGDGVDVIKTYFNDIQVTPMELIDGISMNFTSKIQYVVAFAEIDDKYDNRLTDIDRYKIENLLNVSSILKKYIDDNKLSQNLKILVFVPQVKYIKDAVKQCGIWFKEAYPEKEIKLYDIHSYKSLTLNRIELNEFKKTHNHNVIDIMISVDKLIEGLHLPTVSVEIMLRKTKSPVTYFQQLGRVINSVKPVVFDLINNSSHLYQMKKEYDTFVDMTKWGLDNNREKVMFDKCIFLRDEAKPVEDILQQYNVRHKTPDEIKDELSNVILNNIDYLKEHNGDITVDGFLNKFNLPKHIRKYVPFELHKFGIELYRNQNEVTKYVDEIFKNKLNEIIENEDGLTYTELANKYNINKSTFLGRIKRNKYKIRNLPETSNATEIVKENIEYIENNPDKLNKKQLAEKFNITESALQNCLNRLKIFPKNVEMYSNKLKYAKHKQLIDENIEYILKELKTKSASSIAKQYNLPSSVFIKYLKDKYNYSNVKAKLEIDYEYVIENKDNLTIEELAEKFGFKNKLWQFKSKLVRNGITSIIVNNTEYKLTRNIASKYIEAVKNSLDYITKNEYNESCEMMAEKFGMSASQFRAVLRNMNIKLPVKKSDMEIFIDEHLDYIQYNCMDYTPSGMAVHLMDLFPEYKFSRSGLADRLRKISYLEFKSK